ncbi:MAG TPA: 50S ribosomal protein L6 [Patescibacteria group bacterium]|nr:50S ribosomal protein L6 [Patescibacteria group bacterium]
MSRIGKQVIVIPSGVEVTLNGKHVAVKGPKGALELTVHKNASVSQADGESGKEITVVMDNLDSKLNRSLWGTTRSNIANMVQGVTDGFSKQLEVNGVGYKVALRGNVINLHLGYSHEINFDLPEGIKADVEKNVITISGPDKQLVGHTAAEIRKLRKPEPYKGKGIKYMDEVIRRKAGKAAKAA